MVLAPALVAYWYLEYRAVDQYASTLGFTVRQADNPTTSLDLIGGITNLGNGNTTNTDILFEYIQSQQLISEIDTELNLTAMYSKPDNDPIFAYNSDGTIEDLVKYWRRMVSIYYDNKTGLIELKVLAFDPDDAHTIAQEIVRQGSLMINQLNKVAQADATKYARDELQKSLIRLKVARRALTEFRTVNQIVDPNTDLQGQMGVLNSLQQQFADTMVELDMLSGVTLASDPRIEHAQRKIAVIKERIGEERRKLVISDGSGNAFSSLIGKFEALRVDLQFAEQSYISALTAFDNAVAEAQRKSTYLAAYVKPTMAQRSEYPDRIIILSITTLFLFLIWAIMTLVAYSIRDRR
jgi:capsular polysaccharide transport system permease protein